MEILWWLIILICGAALCFFGMRVVTFPFMLLAELIQRGRKAKNPDFKSTLYEPSSNQELKTDVIQFVISLLVVAIAYGGVYMATTGINQIAEERSNNDRVSSSESYTNDNRSDNNSSSSDDGPIPHIAREPYYVINTSTGKYHRPACGIGGRISDSNRKISYESSEEIYDRGYSPCGKCCP